MYEVILDSIIDEMGNFGLVSTIIISNDYYESMNKKQKEHLEEFLDGSIKWMIVTDRKEYFSLKFSHEPMVFYDY
jgi:predicted transcriptional regulator